MSELTREQVLRLTKQLREYSNGTMAFGAVVEQVEAHDAALRARVAELEGICADAYQVVGVMATDVDMFGHEHTRKILDNLSQAKLVHEDVLPYPCAPQSLETLRQQLAAMTTERDVYDKALHSLTPGGSEYAHDAKACVEAVRRMRASQHEALCSFKRQRDEALNKLAARTYTWTTARPTVAGLWFKKSAIGEPECVKVSHDHETGALIWMNFDTEWDWIDRPDVTYDWAGPIMGPEEG